MKQLIYKFLSGTINNEEEQILRHWLAKPKNKSTFEKYIKDTHLINTLYNNINVDDAYKKVFEAIQKPENTIKTIPLYKRSFFKYAAAILIFVSAGYFILSKENIETNAPIAIENNIKSGTDKAILTTENGETITLEKGQSFTKNNFKSSGEKLVYTKINKAKPIIEYNYLTVPRGGQFFVELSDGTKVWLNSESKLKYPKNFIDGQTRNVELVYGEAYFDVSPSTENKGSKFKVQTGVQEVEVLGTEFNVKAYQDEVNIYTTLVEGKVSVNHSVNQKILMPNQQSILNAENKNIVVKSIDVYNEVSWKDGVFSFEKMQLQDIMKVLGRWYDMDVGFQDKVLKDIEFSGVLGKEQSIEEILSEILDQGFINSYQINDKKVILK